MMLRLLQALFFAQVLYLLWRFVHHKSSLANIPGPRRSSWWNGCFFQVYSPDAWDFRRQIVQKYGSAVKLPMMFGSEELYVADPLALHHVLVKDQNIYEEANAFIAVQRTIFGKGLSATLGEEHRRQRKMLNPVFSTTNMRGLLPAIYPIAHELRDILIEKVRNGSAEIDVMQWISKAALDFIGQAGFGYSFRALQDQKISEYREYLTRVVPLFAKLEKYRHLVPWLLTFGSPALRRKIIECIPSKVIQDHVNVVDVLDSYSKRIYHEKNVALGSIDTETCKQNIMGKDILSELLKVNMAANESDRLPEDEIVGQVNTFIIAGQDTTSHALARALHQLALNPDVQARLQSEIIAAREEQKGSDFTFESLMSLPLLDAVCRETIVAVVRSRT